MTKTAGLQDLFLNKARSEGISVTVFLTNGFQLKGTVQGFDCFTVVIVSDGRQQLIYKHAISTITPLRPISLLDAFEKEEKEEKEVKEEWDPKMKRMFKVVTIDANVTKNDVAEDLTYKLSVEGIDPVYKEEDIFECSFKVYGSDSYVKIFWFTNDEAAMIYPNDYEGDQVFAAGGTYNVPVTDTIELVMAKSDPKVDTEFVNIIILATKKNYPYLGEMDFQSIISWIYQIPADQRVIHHDSTVIK